MVRPHFFQKGSLFLHIFSDSFQGFINGFQDFEELGLHSNERHENPPLERQEPAASERVAPNHESFMNEGVKVLIQPEVQTRALPAFPETGFVRLRQILGVIPVCPTTWWKMCREGKAPKGTKLGRNITVWKAEDIRALIAQLAEN